MQRRYTNVLLVATLAVAILQLWVVIGQIGPPWLQPLLLILLIGLGSLWVWSGMRIPKTYPQSLAPDQSVLSRIPKDEDVYLWLVRRYGLGYDLMDVECEVKKDGVAVHRRLVVRAHSLVEQIDNTLSLQPGPNSSTQVEPPRIKSSDSRRSFGIERGIRLPGAVVVNVSPGLQESEIAEFTLTEEIKGKFFETAVSQEEHEHRVNETDQDFFAWRIDRPTRKLALKVTFPAGATPTAYNPRVFFAPVVPGLPIRQQKEERDRIRDFSLLGVPPQLLLEVDYPVVGLMYAIYWNPPADESLP